MLDKSDTEIALDKRFPEAVALIVTRSKTGQVNMCPIGYFGLCSFKPKVWQVSIYKDYHSNHLITDTKEFVLCLPSLELTETVLYSGSTHGDKEDKLKKLNLKLVKSNKTKIPLIDGSIACFVCKVVKIVKVGDHSTFFGEVIESYDSNLAWRDKIYNWDNKNLGNLEFGKKFKEINFSPEGSVKNK